MDNLDHILSSGLGRSSCSFDVVNQALNSVRTHLGMEVAYLSEFVEGRSIFRAVDAPGLEHLIKVGDSRSLDEVYCQHILEGRLPELIPDTADEAIAVAMPITKAVPIGSHVSIPIRKPDGSPYGMFCCLSPTPNRSLNPRDLDVMRMFSDVVSREINGEIASRMRETEIRSRIEATLRDGQFSLAYQPIFELGAKAPSGFEALCRFSAEPYRTPDVWFAEAEKIGLQMDLELAVVERALDGLSDLPEGVYVSINLSPQTVIETDLYAALKGYPLERIVLELTEHATVTDYDSLLGNLAPLRFDGMKLAVDDAGAGYSGLQHILRLRPDMIKLDMTLTRDIDRDWPRRSLAAALVHFAAETRAVIVAEGIETAGELRALQDLGVHRGQGYFLGRPQDLEAARAWFDQAPKSAKKKAG